MYLSEKTVVTLLGIHQNKNIKRGMRIVYMMPFTTYYTPNHIACITP